MDWIKELRDEKYTAAFQRWCGVVSFGRAVPDNNNLQDGVVNSKFDAVRVNGVKNGYHPTNGVKARPMKTAGQNGIHLTNGHVKPVEEKLCKHKLLTTSDGVQYAILNIPLYFLFRLGALMGNEEFFLGFFPFFMWNVDSVVGRQSIILWSITMYLGQAAKDVIRWPRPASPPVVRLETEHSGEHGMPSTHAMAGTVIPCTLFLLIHDRYEISPYLCTAAAVAWALVVCLSRLYLGVHSVSDVVCGIGSSLLLIASVFPYVEKCDWYIQTHMSAPVVLPVLSLALCTVLYPATKGHSSRVNATVIAASSAGCLLGSWVLHYLGFTRAVAVQTSGRLSVVLPSFDWLVFSVLRFAVGVVSIVGMHTGVGKFWAWAVSYIVGLEKTDKKHPSVVIAYKFITYFSVGLVVLCGVPHLHKALGICRSGFLREVL